MVTGLERFGWFIQGTAGMPRIGPRTGLKSMIRMAP